jgi:hypothetical protein
MNKLSIKTKNDAPLQSYRTIVLKLGNLGLMKTCMVSDQHHRHVIYNGVYGVAALHSCLLLKLNCPKCNNAVELQF